MDEPLPPHARARAFAAVELLLDINYVGQSLVQSDYESTMIYFCVAEATMRPFVLNRDNMQAYENDPTPPEHLRGSISRLLIADRTGLPRETVRRKANALVKSGLLFEDEAGRLRSKPNLGEPSIQNAVNDVYAAVARYNARLAQFAEMTKKSET